MAKLIVSIDGVTIRELNLSVGLYKIGRKPGNEIQVDDEVVSGEHAMIEVMPNPENSNLLDVYAADRNSTNGTLVNNREINRQKLKSGDVVQVGGHEIAYFAD